MHYTTYADPGDTIMLFDWLYDFAASYEKALAEEKAAYGKGPKKSK